MNIPITQLYYITLYYNSLHIFVSFFILKSFAVAGYQKSASPLSLAEKPIVGFVVTM